MVSSIILQQISVQICVILESVTSKKCEGSSPILLTGVWKLLISHTYSYCLVIIVYWYLAKSLQSKIRPCEIDIWLTIFVNHKYWAFRQLFI